MKKLLEDKKCLVCGKVFHPLRITQKFCNRKCQKIGCRSIWAANMRKQQLKSIELCQKITDNKMIEIWNVYKEMKGTASLEKLFGEYGYVVRPEKLKRIVGEEEYKKFIKQNSNMGGRYKKGRRLEQRAKEELLKDGYYAVRTAGSKGLFDVVGINENEFILIQIKSNRPPSQKEVDDIKNFNCPQNCLKQIWVWKDYKGWIKEYYE